jgi:hypothetical protein
VSPFTGTLFPFKRQLEYQKVPTTSCQASYSANQLEPALNLSIPLRHLHHTPMVFAGLPTGLSTAMSTLAISAPHQPSTKPRRCTLAPHRKYAKKFLTLPDELLTNIADNVAPEDLSNFRLTCKTLANIAAKQFRDKRLANRRFIFTEYSLRGLLDMTAHPVFGPCIKSIMFSTDRPTNEVNVLMDALESHDISDHTEVMNVFQLYRKRWAERSAFLSSRLFFRILEVALSRLSSYGTSVSLGIFNEVKEQFQTTILTHGYGTSREFSGLPFAISKTLNTYTFRIIQEACRAANFRPEFYEFDLSGQNECFGTTDAMKELLLTNGQLQAELDVCIREGSGEFSFFPSVKRLEFKQRAVNNQMLRAAEYVRFDPPYLVDRPMRRAVLSMPFTHLHIESCSMEDCALRWLFRYLERTLQVVELVDVAIVGEFNLHFCIVDILDHLKMYPDLQRLVLDDVRSIAEDSDVGFDDYGPDHDADYDGKGPGKTVITGRYWNGRQQIREGLDILTGFDKYGLVDAEPDDWDEIRIREIEKELQDLYYTECEHLFDRTEYLGRRVEPEYSGRRLELEQCLKRFKTSHEEAMAARARAKEAMARFEAKEFST